MWSGTKGLATLLALPLVHVRLALSSSAVGGVPALEGDIASIEDEIKQQLFQSRGKSTSGKPRLENVVVDAEGEQPRLSVWAREADFVARSPDYPRRLRGLPTEIFHRAHRYNALGVAEFDGNIDLHDQRNHVNVRDWIAADADVDRVLEFCDDAATLVCSESTRFTDAGFALFSTKLGPQLALLDISFVDADRAQSTCAVVFLAHAPRLRTPDSVLLSPTEP